MYHLINNCARDKTPAAKRLFPLHYEAPETRIVIECSAFTVHCSSYPLAKG